MTALLWFSVFLCIMWEERTRIKSYLFSLPGFPGGSVVKNPAANTGHMGLSAGSGRSPGEGNSNPLQYSCQGNPMDSGSWQATYSPWGCKRVGHDLETKQIFPPIFIVCHFKPKKTSQRYHHSVTCLPPKLGFILDFYLSINPQSVTESH